MKQTVKSRLYAMCIAAAAVMAAFTAAAQRIAVLSDIHVVSGNANDTRLREAVAEINAADYSAVVVDGDLTNEGSDEQLAYVKAILDSIRHPLYVLPGNHENNWSQSACAAFPRLWGDDKFSAVIDSLVIVGVNCGPYMKMGDGHVKTEDLQWMRDELGRLFRPGMRVVSFCHYPLRAADMGSSADAYLRSLAGYPVAVHVNGHYHAWERYDSNTLPCVMIRALADTRGKKDYGYTLLTVTADSVLVDEKVIGEDPARRFAIAVTDAVVPMVAAPEYVQPQIPGYNAILVDECPESVFTRVNCDRDNAYYATSQGRVIAVDKSTHQRRWEYNVGNAVFSRVTPLKKGKVAVAHSQGITILNASTGAVVAYYPSAHAPYVADGLLTSKGDYLQGGYMGMECRNGKNGRLKWSYDSIANYCQGAPVADGNDIVFGAWDTWLRCLDRKTGRLKWKWSNGRTANMLGPGNVVPVLTEDKVIIVAPDRYMTALDRKTGRQIWRDNSHKYRESLGCSEDRSRVYAKTMDGELVAVDALANEFRELWVTDMGIGYDHAPCVVAERDGTVFVGTRAGKLVGVDAETHDLLWEADLGGSEVNGIDVDPYDGSIWVSLVEGRVYHIRKMMMKPHPRR